MKQKDFYLSNSQNFEENYYSKKYFSLFLNSYKWNGIKKETADYLMFELWHTGAVCSFYEKEINEVDFLQFVPNYFDIHYFPKIIRCVSEGISTPLFPNKPLVVGENTTICSATPIVAGHCESLFTKIYPLCQKLACADSAQNTNILLQKIPFVFSCDSDTIEKMKDIFTKLTQNEPVLYLETDDIKAIQSLNVNAPYVADKLENYKNSVEGEILTILGIDNMGYEKPERLLTDEATSNNNIIEMNSNGIFDRLQNFCEETNTLFGSNISVEKTSGNVEGKNDEDTEKTEEPEKESEVKGENENDRTN